MQTKITRIRNSVNKTFQRTSRKPRVPAGSQPLSHQSTNARRFVNKVGSTISDRNNNTAITDDDDGITMLPYKSSPPKGNVKARPSDSLSLTSAEIEQMYDMMEESRRGQGGLRYEPELDLVDMSGDKEFPQFDRDCMQIRMKPLYVPRRSLLERIKLFFNCITPTEEEEPLPASASIKINTFTTLHRFQGDQEPDLSPHASLRALRRRHKSVY